MLSSFLIWVADVFHISEKISLFSKEPFTEERYNWIFHHIILLDKNTYHIMLCDIVILIGQNSFVNINIYTIVAFNQ